MAIYDAAGQLTTNTYNARGELLTSTDPKGETTTFTYDAKGYLVSADGPLSDPGDTVSLTYDFAGRVHTLTDPDGYSVTNTYDNLDRLTNVTYPDGTFMAFAYDKLDLVKVRDRLGRETLATYDALGRPATIQDPLHRLTRFEYCDCGSLSALIDPMGRPTRWDYDVEGRVISKQYVDGSRRLYTYENTTSRLKSVTDEKGQIKSYEYNIDDNLRRVSYINSQVYTPAVTFTYDTNYNRILSLQDGIGTTIYTFYPVGVLGALQVASVDGPWTNDTVAYQYDELGRVISRVINGVPQTYAYDSAGRTTNIVNALGSFTYDYDGPTARLLDAVYPNGQTTHYDYFDNLGDRRLKSITNLKPDTSLISRFTYAYNAVGDITNWLQELGVVTNDWSIDYDAADQLLSVHDDEGGGSADYAYGYDTAGNRLLETVGTTNRTFQYNALNQLISSSDAALTNATYSWDADQRLVAVDQGTNRSEFSYDGLGRRVRIVEKQNGVIVEDRSFLWCGMMLCEERDATGAVVEKRYFDQGVQAVTGPSAGDYFYALDHLGSVREMTDVSGSIRARYAFDPYGVRAKLGGDLETDLGFTGHFFHQPSALQLAPYRAYDSAIGRWLSRDPIAESGGRNLYVYVGNNPARYIDRLGLERGKLCIYSNVGGKSSSASIGGHAAISYTVYTDCGSGATTTYGLWPDSHPAIQAAGLDNGFFNSDVRVNFQADNPAYFPHKRCRMINDEQVKTLKRSVQGLWIWQLADMNCSWFAARIYNGVTGEHLDARIPYTPVNTPRTLGVNIDSANSKSRE